LTKRHFCTRLRMKSTFSSVPFGDSTMEDKGLRVTDPVISIGALARKVGLSVSAIRKYESEGLIIPYRTGSGRRLFSIEDVDRIGIIHNLIRKIGLNIEGIRRLQAVLPCWELSSEEASAREQCPAFKDSTKPCWMIKGAGDPAQAEKCRNCAVYRFGSQCTEDIKEIIFGGRAPEDNGMVVELIRRRRVS
jgi:MerR family transcriptional regulator/heat shock protein HspR